MRSRLGSVDVLQWLLTHCPEHLNSSFYQDVCGWFERTEALALVRWLHETAHCPWDVMQLARAAVESEITSNLRVLDYMKEQGVVWSAHQLTTLLQYAGTRIQGGPSVKWLRNEGAAWPDILAWNSAQWGDLDDHEFHLTYFWTDEAVEWARAQGMHSNVCNHIGPHASCLVMSQPSL